MTMRRVALAVLLAAGAITMAPTAQADPDTDFATQLHQFGIYGPRDYNAWIGKIACTRLAGGVDADAYQSAAFVSEQLQHGSTTDQAWKFLGLAIATYCPDQTPALQRAARTS